MTESSKSATSSISSSSKKQTIGEEPIKHPDLGIVGLKKTRTTVEEEKTMTKHLSENTKLITGPLDEIMPIVKTETIKYDPTSVSSRNAQSTKSVPVIATETRKVAYTETRVSVGHKFLIASGLITKFIIFINVFIIYTAISVLTSNNLICQYPYSSTSATIC